MKRAVIALIGALACVSALAATAGPAGAATAAKPLAIPHVIQAGGRTFVYTSYLAGYATENSGDAHFSDMRATISLPSQAASGTPIPANTYGGGVCEQDSAVSLSSEAACEGWIWAATADVGGVNCGPGAYELEYGTGDSPSYVPLPVSDLQPAQTINPISLTAQPVCSNAPAGSFMAVDPSMRSGWIQFYEGTAWNNDTDYGALHLGGYNPWNVGGVGIDSALSGGASVASDLNLGSLATVVNARINDGKANRGLFTMNVAQFDGTLTGGAPSVADPLTLSTSTINSLNDFTITAP